MIVATKTALNTKVTEIKNKIPDTSDLITISEFNRLTKVFLETKMKEAAKRLVSKCQVDSVFDIPDKMWERMKEL